LTIEEREKRDKLPAIRKIAATRAADKGATEAELMAIFGWTDPKMSRTTRAPPTESGSPLRQWRS
jgi:hypothetical protein